MIRIEPATDLAVIVDVQPTFMPGGALPVPGGDEIVPVVNGLLRRFRHAAASQDWHPADHLSFASQHPGRRPGETIALPYGPQILWPDHAVAGSADAALHEALDQSRIEIVIRKGMRRHVDSYSTFVEADRETETGFAAWVLARGFRRLFFAGLALDFCVVESALSAAALRDAAGRPLELFVVEDACRGVGIPLPDGSDTIQAAKARLRAAGVRLIASHEIAGEAA
jgi:nicotinamidase/pyrazinamidase